MSTAHFVSIFMSTTTTTNKLRGWNKSIHIEKIPFCLAHVFIALINLSKKSNYLEGSIDELVDGATGVSSMCCVDDCMAFGDDDRDGEIECADDDGDDILC